MSSLTRREFLKAEVLGIGSLLLPPQSLSAAAGLERLGRVVETRLDVRARPDVGSQAVATLDEDAVIPWYREVIGVHPYRINQRWVETDGGYVYAPALQPVQDLPNIPIDSLSETSLGPGFWTEVSVPWVDVALDNPPARAPWLVNSARPRLYYSQIVWVDAIRQADDGSMRYRINERFGYGDLLIADARAFRPLSEAEVTPLAPEVEDKRVVVNLERQSLSCFESGREVYYCRVSTGIPFDVDGNPTDESTTPPGPHPVWRKLISVHMVGGTTGGGWDLPGVGWTSLFVGNGVAIHSTFWHNDFGVPRSRGCVNAQPEDAKWVFRWLAPVVPYDPGDVTVGMPGGTIIEVVEA